MTDNPLLNARQAADRTAESPEERNRAWWASLPMTYKPWEATDRGLSDAEILSELTSTFLSVNPWLARNVDFGAFAGRDVLEVGCGAGAASCLFGRGGARVIAIDLTEQAIELTARMAARLALPVTPRQMNVERMDLPDASFDYVFSWGVIHHTHTTENAVREIARVLRPGGRGLCMVYNRDSLRYWLKGAIWLFLKGRVFRGDSIATAQRFFTDGYYHRHLGKAEFARVLADNGLVVERMSATHMAKKMIPFLPRAVDEWLKRRYGWLLVAEFRRR